MTDRCLTCEYFILSFVPSVLSDESIPIGVLLQEIETVATEKELRFAGARFVQDLRALPLVDLEADETLIAKAILEMQTIVKRAFASGRHNELNALLQELLNANSGLCAFGPYACRAAGNPELDLEALFERSIRRQA